MEPQALPASVRDLVLSRLDRLGSATARTLRLGAVVGERFDLALLLRTSSLDEPAGEDSLYRPQPGDARERGRYPGRVKRTSLYTRARLHPEQLLVGLAVAGAGYVIAKQARSGRR